MFRLALALGTTVRELEGSLSASELSEWMEFYSLEPWGSHPAFWRSGMIASLMANINRDDKKKPTPFTPEDFMPRREDKTKKLDPKLVKAKFMEAFGPGVKTHGRKGKLHDTRGQGDGRPVKRDGAEGSSEFGSESAKGGGEADSKRGQAFGSG